MTWNTVKNSHQPQTNWAFQADQVKLDEMEVNRNRERERKQTQGWMRGMEPAELHLNQ